MKKSAGILILIVLVFSQCKKDSGNNPGNNLVVDCSTVTNKAFAADVLPIFQASCAVSGCHATGSGNGPGALTNYSQISAAKTRIRQAIVTGAMPQGSTLTTAQRSSIVCWIDSGAPNN